MLEDKRGKRQQSVRIRITTEVFSYSSECLDLDIVLVGFNQQRNIFISRLLKYDHYRNKVFLKKKKNANKIQHFASYAIDILSFIIAHHIFSQYCAALHNMKPLFIFAYASSYCSCISCSLYSLCMPKSFFSHSRLFTKESKTERRATIPKKGFQNSIVFL